MRANIYKLLVIVAVLVTSLFVYTKLIEPTKESTIKNDASYRPEEQKNDTRVLAKNKSSFTEFNEKDYEIALSEGKIVYLEFYANWCPICRAQEADLIDGFNKLSRADVAGFRVNFKDDQTDEIEKALAEKYKIPYQHHKIVIKNGRVVIDSADTWDAQTLVSELSNL